MQQLASYQLDTPITNPPAVQPSNPRQQSDGTMSRTFYQWLLALTDRVQQAAQSFPVVSLKDQAAAIGTSAMPLASLTAGVYRVSVRIRITQAASVSSSVAVTISAVDGGISSAQAGGALTGNTTNASRSDVFIVRVDGATPISYAFAYTSVGATAMQFAADLVVEQIA